MFEEDYKNCFELIDELKADTDTTPSDWLVEQTEKFCQEKALHNAILESIQILDGKSKTDKSKGSIPQILSDALSISFDPNIGHDYIDNAAERYEFYHRKETRIPFDLDFFNRITKGGLPQKTLNIALAGTGVGKSLFMCHMAAGCLTQNLNVLYITMEMSEERIAERIDANLLNVKLDDLANLPKDIYERKISRLKENIKGKLIIKEYPTATASSIHFRNLLNELALKKHFIPHIIFIDYLNICSSARLKHGANVNSYSYIKAIAEELRGLAVEFSVPIVSATQTTRSGFTNTDPGLEDTSESFGLPATADMMFALITSEELESLNQIMVKQLKNRYNDPTLNKKFAIGIDRSKMRLYDIEESAQSGISDSGQKSSTQSSQNSSKSKFSGLKV
ncbi:41 helicase [uncultured Caudovirales phage]|uniref:41 helicase n=1 Tax=uncultured Caudovirales phage TaxID=2100421 RepID=A0A6J5KSU4_9CAUD|nr:41 helicase [uncultured Caudovirales phage]